MGSGIRAVPSIDAGRDGATVLLSALLDDLDVHVEPFAVCDVAGGHGLRLDGREHATFHFVVAGHGELVLRPGPRIPLHPFHLAVVPEGLGHELVSSRAGKPPVHTAGHRREAADGITHLTAGPEETPQLQVACGRVDIAYRGALDLFRLLQDPIVLDFSDGERMRSRFEELLRESAALGPGSRVVMEALMSQCVVDVFRRLCDSPECRLPWVVALEDDRLMAAVEAVLRAPNADHTVSSLARTAAMSRSAFAEEFATHFDRTPMVFVRDVRLQRAAALLRTTDAPVASVARRVGFSSRSHFSSAFRERYGETPSGFRAAGDA